jgi:transposase
MSKSDVFVGIDISKAELQVATRPEGKPMTFANTEDGIAFLIEFLKSLCPSLVVLEATGGLEIAVVNAMAVKEFPVVVVNARQIRDFAKALGRLAKTDRVDAEVIAQFAEAVRPVLRPLKDEQTQRLQALNTRRSQLVAMIRSEQNRLHSAPKWTVKEIQSHLKWLKNALEKMDKEIADLIKGSPIWCEKNAILQSFKGVGPVTSAILLAAVPELGSIASKPLSALIGVAPLNRDSGQSRGKRVVWGGRQNVRSVLYMATMAAIRFNPVISVFYTRLRDAGKPHKVAITACMRKTIVTLNSMIKNQRYWHSPIPEKCFQNT